MIKIIGPRAHAKASERYIDVIFSYPDGSKWEGSVPIEYRRTGTFANTKPEIERIINSAFEVMKPENAKKFIDEQKEFWKNSDAEVTKSFFEGLLDSKWKCVACDLPKNPNWARRTQDLKEMGYTLATNTKMHCKKCDKNTTHLILVRFPRGQETGYETWTPKLRAKILILEREIHFF